MALRTTARSPSRAPPRPPRARRSVLVDGPPARPDRRVLPARQRAARALDRDRRLGAQTRLPVLVPAHPRRGLRLRPAVADQQEAAAPRDHRRRRALPRRPRHLERPTRRCARPNASSRCRPSAPTNAPSTTGRPRRRARARHRGAHLKGRQAAKQRGRPQSPSVCALAPSVTRARTALSHRSASDPDDLTFIRRPLRQRRRAQRVFSAWFRTWSGARRRETSGSPPGSGSPSCPGP